MVMGFAGGVGAPGVSVLMRRFDGAVAAGALGVVCALALAPLVVLLGVLLWAKALLAVHGNINRTPPNRTPFSAVGRNFIRTLFPARCLAPRSWAIASSQTSEDALFVTIHRLDAEELCCLSQFLFDPQ
jgi:hypothetical protein